MGLLDTLNEPQRRAVQVPGGPVLVLAGPGSGKTRVLTHRIAHLIGELRVDPYNILAVTFTNKAANEMRERLTTLIGPDLTKRLTVGTFHSICARWLRQELPVAPATPRPGIFRNFTIYDEDDQQRLMRRVLKELQLDEKQFAPRAILHRISTAKNELAGPSGLRRVAKTHWEEKVVDCFDVYQRRLSENNAVDFDDLMVLMVNLLEGQPELLRRFQLRYEHVLIDEYQDVNTCQYELSKLLSGGSRNLFAVGDEDQAVYAFRGADMRYVLQFEDDFPDATVVMLEQNYRSTQAILDVASALMARSDKRKREKHLWTEKNKGLVVSVQEGYSEEEEATLVVDEIERLVSKDAASLQEIAVLYRTNAQSRVLEESFIRRSLRYRLVGGVRFYDRKEIKDVIAYLRVISNLHDDIGLERALESRPGIGRQTIAQLNDWATEHGLPLYTTLQLLDPEGEIEDGQLTPHNRFMARARNALVEFLHVINELWKASQERNLVELLGLLLERTAFHEALIHEYGDEDGESRWENVLELRTVASQYAHFPVEEQLRAFLEEIALVAATDDLIKSREAVTLMTMHQAKGLEFPVVFVVGLEEGLMPHTRSLDDPEQLEEERRLLYVAMTRSMERLYLLHAFKRTLYGRQNLAVPSRFLGDIPAKLVKRSREAGDRSASQASMFTGRSTLGAGVKGRTANGWSTPAKKNTTPLKPSPNAKFVAGTKVRHDVFGEGIVVSSEVKNDDEEVTVAFAGKGVKRLLAGFAKLEKLNRS